MLLERIRNLEYIVLRLLDETPSARRTEEDYKKWRDLTNRVEANAK